MSIEAIAALFGRVYDDGTSLDLAGGLNFTGGLRASLNEAAGRIDLSIDPSANDLLVNRRITLATSRDAEAADVGATLVYTGSGDVTYTLTGAHFSTGTFVDLLVLGAGTITVAAGGTGAVLPSRGQTLTFGGQDRIARVYCHGEPGDTPNVFTLVKYGEQEYRNPTLSGGLPTAQVAPNAALQVSALADGVDSDYDAAIADEGVYKAGVSIILKRATTGDYRTWIGSVDFMQESGTVTLIGSASEGASGDATGLTVTISASGGNLRTNIDNGTGESVSGYVHVQWLKSDLVA